MPELSNYQDPETRGEMDAYYCRPYYPSKRVDTPDGVKRLYDIVPVTSEEDVAAYRRGYDGCEETMREEGNY